MTTNGTSRTLYLDSSAIVKLIVPEEGSQALVAFIAPPGTRILSSALAITEVSRLAQRRGPETTAAAVIALESVNLVPVSAGLLAAAAALLPAELRTLDAIHVATALEFGPEIGALVTYDRRMQEAARLAGLTVIAPGQMG